MSVKKVIDVCDLTTYPNHLIQAFEKKSTNEECLEIIKDDELLCFHYTRLYDKNIILKYGLKGFDKQETVNYVVGVYKKIYKNQEHCNMIRQVVAEHLKNYEVKDDKQIWNTKQGKLCFVAGKCKKTNEYVSYFCMFGGECISNATKKLSFHNELINIGKNYCVEFRLPVRYIKENQKGVLGDQLINIMRYNYIEKQYNYFEGYLYNKSIPKEYISKIWLK